MYSLPDYRYKQLAEALAAYGFSLDAEHYALREYTAAGPDKDFYFFTAGPGSDKILVLLTEDYISGQDYVRNCFGKEINARLVELHKVVRDRANKDFGSRAAVQAVAVYKPPDDWDELSAYAVDFPPFFFGFLASVLPNDPKHFWEELHNRLGSP